jgi:hypothetical protein
MGVIPSPSRSSLVFPFFQSFYWERWQTVCQNSLKTKVIDTQVCFEVAQPMDKEDRTQVNES